MRKSSKNKPKNVTNVSCFIVLTVSIINKMLNKAEKRNSMLRRDTGDLKKKQNQTSTDENTLDMINSKLVLKNRLVDLKAQQ